MRTTVEISDEQRSKLLEAAAKRGEKGFSSVVQEALSQYFAAQEAKRELVQRALKAVGSLSEEAADRLEKDVRSLRRTWR